MTNAATMCYRATTIIYSRGQQRQQRRARVHQRERERERETQREREFTREREREWRVQETFNNSESSSREGGTHTFTMKRGIAGENDIYIHYSIAPSRLHRSWGVSTGTRDGRHTCNCCKKKSYLLALLPTANCNVKCEVFVGDWLVG
jgi:hypothetical protein